MGLFEQSVGGVSYGEDKEMVSLAIPNDSSQHTWHVSHSACDPWKWQEEKGHLGLVATVAVLISVRRCQLLWHVALPPTAAAQRFLLLLSTSHSTWCQGKAYGWGHSALSAVPETKAWLFQTLPRKTLFLYIHKLYRERGKEERRCVCFAFPNET